MRFLKRLACTSLLLTAISGCSSKTDQTVQSSSPSSSEKTYIVATDTSFPPFEFSSPENKLIGIDVDLLDAIAEDQKFAYELRSVGFDEAMKAVQNNEADGILAGMSITEGRKDKFDFSAPYYDSEIAVAVAKKSGIKTLNDLKGQKVAVKAGTEGEEYAKSLAKDYDLEIVEFKDSPSMYQDVVDGNTAACFEDYPVMAFNIQQGTKLVIPEGLTADGNSYGFAVKKGENQELLNMFDQGLQNVKDSGLFDRIVKKYTR
ncbi:MAG: transporter substrate-binding domain-containing protein [Erysipelotrichaceae bacterium]|nr:transporter substrate-binding domain-containing protein [Erysipelotrichaceae bacterium]